MPLVWLTVVQFVMIAVWGYTANTLYRKVYPPRKVIMVYGERPMRALMEKIYSRADRFVISASARIDTENAEEIKRELLQYEGVVVCDLPSVIRNDLLKFCYGHSIRFYLLPKITDVILMGAEELHVFDSPMLVTREYSLTVEQRMVKRCIDIMGALILLVIASPFMLLTALAIKLYDGGPVLYKQVRCTLNQKGILYHEIPEYADGCGE